MEMIDELSSRGQKLTERKEKAIKALSVQFSKNAMPIEEYERLIEYIHKAESERELALIEKIVDESAAYENNGKRQFSTPDSSPLDSFSDITFFASRVFSGDSLVEKPRSFFTFFGVMDIMIYDGQLPVGKTIVNALSLFSNTVIKTPRNVSVTMEANALLGNVSVEGVPAAKSYGVPELVVRGAAFFGSLIVQAGK